MKKGLIYIYAVLFCLTASGLSASAQFKEQAFQQTYNDTTVATAQSDSTDKLFSFNELFGGVAHKRDVRIGTLFGGSVFLPGLSQIHNRDYWKLPVVYGGMGVCAGLGGYYINEYKKSIRLHNEAKAVDPYSNLPLNYKAKTTGTWLLVGAGLFYWGSLMDGVACYKKDVFPQPGKATIYSILLPGLGQAYNGEYWKIPIYWGCLLGAGHFLYNNHTNYIRFKRIHNEVTSPNPPDVQISADNAKWYRDTYRRYRDYSIVALVGFYLLQVIDANVFAYMHDFEVSDDVTMSVAPSVIAPDANAYAMGSPVSNTSAFGFSVGLKF